ncbi:MAG: hypothetical protein KC731_23820, partial [Myxococcales bacterium]|nr:hypothetical protein [Myxococcales bacterium]
MPLEKLGRWLGDAFSGRNRSLRDVNGPSQVLVEGEIASPNVIESPVTPVRAAIMTVGVLREHVARNE